MSLIGIIVGMAVVTFLTLFFPVVWVQSWLEYIPYAALGALIFPGILTVEASAPWIGLGGGLVAVVLALLRFHTVCVTDEMDISLMDHVCDFST